MVIIHDVPPRAREGLRGVVRKLRRRVMGDFLRLKLEKTLRDLTPTETPSLGRNRVIRQNAATQVSLSSSVD